MRLALPLFLGYLAYLAFNLLNAWFVQRLSVEALAAVSASSFVLWGMIALGELASVGTLALVARAIGAGDPRAAGAAALHGAALGLLLGLVGAAAGPWVVPWLVTALGLGGETGALAVQYLTVLFYAYPTLTSFFVLEAVCRAAGHTAVTMVVLAVSFACNALLDWALIFGQAGAPALGVEGAALATGLARGAGCLALLGYVVARRRALGLAWPGARLDPALLARIARIGLPASAAGLGFAGIYVALSDLTARFGDAAVAALGVGLRMEGLAFIMCQAYGRAAATITGQNLGAGQVERARAATRRALLHALALMVPMTLTMVGGADVLAVWLMPDRPEVAAPAAAYLRIAGLALFGMALEVVLENVAGGVGDTLPAMAIEVIGTALRLPIALGLAAAGLGYHAVWWSVAITCVTKGLAFEVWFRRGRWARAGTLA